MGDAQPAECAIHRFEAGLESRRFEQHLGMFLQRGVWMALDLFKQLLFMRGDQPRWSPRRAARFLQSPFSVKPHVPADGQGMNPKDVRHTGLTLPPFDRRDNPQPKVNAVRSLSHA